MDDVIMGFRQYLEEVLGIHVLPEEWMDGKGLPLYICQRYSLYRVILQRIPCVLVVSKVGEPTPDMIAKHLKQVMEKTERQPIFVNRGMKSYDRKRLIQKNVPFVVPGNQLYVPFLGMDLRERMIRQPQQVTQLTASAQYLLLYLLMQRQDDAITPSTVAAILGYSKMTMTRAFQELESAGIGTQKRKGRTKTIQLGEPKQQVWQQALPYLKSPVQKSIFVRGTDQNHFNEEQAVLAGDSALSEISDMAEPRITVYAIHHKKWEELKEHYREVPYPENDTIEIQLWAHPVPRSFSGSWVYEPALYLTMINEEDDRLQAALNKMMEAYTW